MDRDLALPREHRRSRAVHKQDRRGLDTCFKLVRVTEANCSTSANDAAQRQECLQNARKVQLACLELAGPQASASVDRPPAATGAVSPDKPAEAAPPVVATGAIPSVNPVAGASADQGESQSAKTSAAAPSDKSVAAISPGRRPHRPPRHRARQARAGR